MIGLAHYMVLAAAMVTIGFVGMAVNRNNLMAILMCLELMLLGVNINFVAIDTFLQQVDGQIAVFFILAVSACEAAVGLAIFVLLYRSHKALDTENLNQLTG